MDTYNTNLISNRGYISGNTVCAIISGSILVSVANDGFKKMCLNFEHDDRRGFCFIPSSFVNLTIVIMNAIIAPFILPKFVFNGVGRHNEVEEYGYLVK